MWKFIAVLFVVLLTACGHESRLATLQSCPLPPGLPEGQLLLFGEMHGSAEVPALISDLACALSRADEIAVGLEVPSQDQALIDRYLGSRGTRSDVEALTASSFWRQGRDGRSSAAMLKLVEDIRVLKRKGHAIALFAFDDQPGTGLERNVAIANGIRRFHDTHAGTRIIALMGNIHAMQVEWTTGDNVLVPSGLLLRDLNPVSILINYPEGTIWACMPQCGIQKLEAKPPAGPDGFRPGSPLAGYSHSYLLPSITASPPAVQD